MTFSVGPWVTVSCVEAPRAVVEVMAAELALAPADAVADLVVRFSRGWSAAGPVTRLGRHGGCDDAHVFVCDTRGERLGMGVQGFRRSGVPATSEPVSHPAARTLHSAEEWVATEGFDPWVLLGWMERWARVRSLERGGAWVHGAAVGWEGEGWLLTGWGGAGKTDLLGAALRAGGQYHADDWAAVGQDRRLYPTARRLNLLAENWRTWPEWRRAAGPVARGARALAVVGRALPGRLGRWLGEAGAARVRKRVYAEALFPCAAAEGPLPLRCAALLVAGERPGFRIEACDVRHLIPRILAAHAAERRVPLDAGALVGFARPCLPPGWTEIPVQQEAAALQAALGRCRAWVVTLGPGSDPNMVWRRLARGSE